MHGIRSLAGIPTCCTLALLASLPARAQCLEWKSGFHLPGVDGTPRAWATFDDGTGPAIFVAGNFLNAGDVAANHVARWDGSTWSALGSGTNAQVAALAVFDDGSGAALYAGGTFSSAGGVYTPGIARWNGSSWAELDPSHPLFNPDVQSLAVHDDGGGPALFVAGNFNVLGVPGVSGVARWDGSSWTPVGSGFATGGVRVPAIAVFDDGSGPALFLGGDFDTISGVPAHGLAKWDGSAWSGLGSVLDGQVEALATYDDGSGTALYVGGDFTTVASAAAGGFARFDGSSWTPLGAALLPPYGAPGVQAIQGFDDGRGPAVYVGGWIQSAGGVTTPGIARWKNGAWAGVGGGVDDSHVTALGPGVAKAFGVFDDGTGSALYVGGAFDTAGGVTANQVARWSLSSWSPIGSGNGLLAFAKALALFDDGAGLALYAGTQHHLSTAELVHDFVRWDGAAWSRVGNGIDEGEIECLAVHDDGSGSSLFAGGTFTGLGGVGAQRIARWDGSAWHALGSGMEKPGDTYVDVQALRGFDDGSGPALYAGGYFTIAGGVPASYIARWDGASWSAVGSGLDGAVTSLEVFDDGTGPALFAGGYFNYAGATNVSHVAKWNGMAWSSLDTGTHALPGGQATVRALAVVDLGSGRALFAGGDFSGAGNVYAPYVARWDGSSWAALGAGPPTPVDCLIGFDDGWGLALHAGGVFSPHTPGGISRWNGSSWSYLGGGVSLGEEDFHFVTALASGDLDGDGGRELYLGGNFGRAGLVASSGIAAWLGCVPHGAPVCLGDGSGAPCPCGNSGWPGSGCNNAVASGGASLHGRGTPSLGADTLFLDCTSIRPNVLCVVLQGDAKIGPVFDGDGLRCIGGRVKRLYAHNASGSSLTVPAFGDATLSARSAALGDPLSAGDRRIYQVYYRDKSPTFCPNPPGNTWNLSSGLSVDWMP